MTLAMKRMTDVFRGQPPSASMIKALIILVLAAAIFGGAALTVYELFVKPEQALAEPRKRADPEPPPPDPTLKDYAVCLEVPETKRPAHRSRRIRGFHRPQPALHKSRAKRATLSARSIPSSFFPPLRRPKRPPTSSKAATC